MRRYTVESIQTDDGLPDNFIADIVQDHHGYLWFGSHSGLIRYNGYSYERFVNIPGDSTTIGQSWVESIYFASDSTLWIGTDKFVSRYFPKEQNFLNYAYDPKLNDFVELGQINDIIEDPSNNIWFAMQKGGLVCYESKSKQFKRYLDDKSKREHLLNDQVRTLLWASNGHLWIGTGEPFGDFPGGGVLKFNPKTGYIKRFIHSPKDSTSLVDNRVGAIFEDHLGKIWVGTCKSGLHWYEEEKDEFVRCLPGENAQNGVFAPSAEIGAWSGCPLVKVITEDQLNRLWIGTYNGGINIYDRSTGSLDFYHQNPSEPKGFTDNLMWSSYLDNQNRMWVGSISGGLNKFDKAKTKFQKLVRDPRASNTLSGKFIIGIYQAPSDPEHLWIGTEKDGINLLNINTGEISHLKHDSGNPNSLSSNGIWCFYEDLDNNFWIGTVNGLNLYDREKNIFKRLYHNPKNVNSLSGNGITTLLEDQHGFLWIGTWGAGICQMNKNTEEIKRFSFGEVAHTSFQQTVFEIHIDNEKQLWIPTWKGALHLFDYQSQTFTKYMDGIGAHDLWEDENNIFWVATENHGLIKFNARTKKIEQQFTIKDGLPSMTTYKIIPDNNRNLWISSSNGLIHFNLSTKKITTYDTTDGLPNNTFSHQTGVKTKDGTIFFGTHNGLVFFNPDQITYNLIPPSLVIDDIEINGKSYSSETIDTKLDYNQRDITFSYTGIHFTKSLDNKYSYRLDPYESEWSSVTTERTVRYTNLDPDQYTFYVKSANSDGVWTETPTTFSFEIRPPWWATWWARSIFVILILTAIYYAYQFQLNKKIAQSEADRLKELDQLKSRLYTNITHEFRTPLSIILGVAKQVKREAQTKLIPSIEMMERNGRQLLRLVNQLLDLSKIESGKFEFNYQKGDIINFLKYLTEAFHSLAEQKAIQLHFLSDLDNLVMDFDQQQLQQIFYNLISNALKFTPEGGHIYFQVAQLSDSMLEVKVRDTGIGIPEDQLTKIFDRFYQLDDSDTRRAEGSGIGLALVKELIKKMQGNIEVRSKPNRGTEFILTLPIERQALNNSVFEQKVFFTDLNQPLNPTQGLKKIGAIQGHTILVIEDNHDVRDYIKNCLISNYQIEMAVDGEEGVQRALKIIPDLIICDVMMPLKDGFEVCDILKNDRRTSHIPFIMLTAKADFQSKLQGLKKGADVYLAKPFQEEELLLYMQNLLLHQERLQQHYLFVSGLNSQLDSEQVLEDKEADFVENVKAKILDHLTDSAFTVSQLSREMTLSESQLHRKLKALTGFSASRMIRLIRLTHAKKLLQNHSLTIASVAYDSGFNDPDYMSKVFKKEFGMTPTNYRIEQKAMKEV